MTEVHVHGAHATVRAPGLEDEVAVEEPLEIRVDGRPLVVTMRTPGHDEELALGFLYGEGLIDGPRAAGPPADLAANTVEVAGRCPATRPPATSSPAPPAGSAGRARWRRSRWSAPPVARRAGVRRALARRPPGPALRQPTFERTGGLHATGLFTPDGELACVREDVGRHNAMDKVVGWALEQGLVPLWPHVLCVSGRLSFELVQKAAVAGAPVLVGVGAPTSLAVRLAADRNMTLCGFARDGRVNVYTGAERVR